MLYDVYLGLKSRRQTPTCYPTMNILYTGCLFTVLPVSQSVKHPHTHIPVSKGWWIGWKLEFLGKSLSNLWPGILFVLDQVCNRD